MISCHTRAGQKQDPTMWVWIKVHGLVCLIVTLTEYRATCIQMERSLAHSFRGFSLGSHHPLQECVEDENCSLSSGQERTREKMPLRTHP